MQKNNNITVTFKIPPGLNRKLNECVGRDDYGMRGKSRWIREAIKDLFTYENFSDLVSLDEDMEKCDQVLTARFPKGFLEEKVVLVRKDHPELEGVKSKIIRTAIMQRILRK